ncbi:MULTISPECIES: hypothetical protein [unclassified Moraxella]|uniref:hypothetical protein n=1 Tax=unclassified Moraxella TaxID=2685852 RepID=UPI002B40D73D|nr:MULTISPECIES: hypothetical protein [unclassified Moraxella]
MFKTKLQNFMIFLLVWAFIAWLLAIFTQPKAMKVGEYFHICVLDKQTPKAIAIKDYQNEPFCDTPFDYKPINNPMFRFKLDKMGDEWQITEYTDSLSDPHIYRYKIIQNQAIPISHQYGGMATKFSAVICGLFLTAFLRMILKRIKKKKAKNT